jgi:hypothetical protein
MKVIANASNFNISSFFCSENSQSNMENILWDNNLFILIWTRTLFRGSQNPTTILPQLFGMRYNNYNSLENIMTDGRTVFTTFEQFMPNLDNGYIT